MNLLDTPLNFSSTFYFLPSIFQYPYRAWYTPLFPSKQVLSLGFLSTYSKTLSLTSARYFPSCTRWLWSRTVHTSIHPRYCSTSFDRSLPPSCISNIFYMRFEATCSSPLQGLCSMVFASCCRLFSWAIRPNARIWFIVISSRLSFASWSIGFRDAWRMIRFGSLWKVSRCYRWRYQ